MSARCGDDPLVGEIVAEVIGEPRANVPLRLFAGANYLVLAGRAPAYTGALDPWPAFRAILEAKRSWLRRFVTEQPVQTNEVRRSWGLLPGFLAAAAAAPGRPLDLVELGPSGGLNLLLDRYHFRYGEGEWGVSDSALALAGRERGRVPAGLLGTPLEVRGRIGIDRQPVDVASEHGALLLQAFVWADEPERLERVRRAIAMARRAPPELLAGDYLELLPELLSRRRADGLTVVFSSNSTEYLDDASYGRLAEAIEAAGRRAPLAWVSAEPPRERRASGYVLELQLWPGGERRRLARVHYHGAWIDWIA